MEIVSVHIVIQGHVQGIGFRAFVCEEARELGVDGIVENLADGDVKAIGIGTRAILEKFIERVKAGNGYSIIEKVHIKWHEDGEPTGEFKTVESTWW